MSNQLLSTEYLLIGGGVAGTNAAEVIRQSDPTNTITVISEEPYRLYSRIMLSKPNFFLGKIPFDQIWLKSDTWYAENKIQLLTGKSATLIDPEQKIITLNDGSKIQYKKLLLAPGVCARRWSLPGADKKGVLGLRTLDDAKEIITRVKKAKHVVCVGGGFISFEMCDILRPAGLEVTLILRESYFWEPLLDETSGRMIEDVLKKNSVKILYSAEVAEVLGNDSVSGAILKDGSKIECDLIIVGIGTFCAMDWVVKSGISTNQGILTNEFLETNKPDIWAAGDAAEFNDLILNEQIQLGNWANAQMQGRTAGLNMCGKKTAFKMISFYTTQGFGLNIAFIGDVRMDTDRQVLARDDRSNNSYGRLIFKNKKLIGATLLNRTAELGAIAKLIERGFSLDGKEKNVEDVKNDLKKLIL